MTFNVTLPESPPPDKPVPATTSVMSPPPPPETVVQDKVPLPSVFKTSFALPSVVGRVKDVPLFNVLAYTIP